MTTSDEILKMIETVDPSDEEVLDEIDARVWCFLNNKKYKSHESGYVKFMVINGNTYFDVKEYTRSRDALKAIRPEGWKFEIYCWGNGNRISFFRKKEDRYINFYTETLPTEELAELHAIIQAIAYERQQS